MGRIAATGPCLYEGPRLRVVRASSAASPWRQHPPDLRATARLLRALGLLGLARWRRCATVSDPVGRDSRLAVRPAICGPAALAQAICRHASFGFGPPVGASILAMKKASLSAFLAGNPFPDGWTDGLFYREKMRAIHRIAPANIGERGAWILEIGGGRSGLAGRLYPDAEVVTLDLDFALRAGGSVAFVCGDARQL